MFYLVLLSVAVQWAKNGDRHRRTTMAKFSFSFDDKRVVIVNEQSKKVDDKLDLIEHVELSAAFKALTDGRRADVKASDVAISMLCDVLDNPRLDEYKGKTPHNEKVPPVFLSALRDVETSVFRPAFEKHHTNKGATAGKIEKLWQDFRKDELSTGSYSNARSYVCKMFAHMGSLPKAPNGKMLPLHAVKRMYESWKAEQEGGNPKKTFADELVALSSSLHNGELTERMGELPDAIAALKRMLATCETLYNLELQRLTELKGNPDIMAQGKAAIVKASKASQTEEAPI